jgi:glycosyltransferase involved in cell wall biosynthesis
MAMAAATQCWSELGCRGLLERTDRVPAAKLHVVPPLVYVDLPPAWEPRDGDLVAIFIGAFGRLKGLPMLLEAMKGIGSGLRLEVITADAAPTDLPSNVNWLGVRPRQEVLSRLVSADIHVFPSRTESFGGVVVEALAAGIPQIVDASGVPAEIVGEAGILVPGQDPAAITDAMERLAAHADLRDRLRSASLVRYRDRYAPEVVGARLSAIVDGL